MVCATALDPLQGEHEQNRARHDLDKQAEL